MSSIPDVLVGRGQESLPQVRSDVNLLMRDEKTPDSNEGEPMPSAAVTSCYHPSFGVLFHRGASRPCLLRTETFPGLNLGEWSLCPHRLLRCFPSVLSDLTPGTGPLPGPQDPESGREQRDPAEPCP